MPHDPCSHTSEDPDPFSQAQGTELAPTPTPTPALCRVYLCLTAKQTLSRGGEAAGFVPELPASVVAR